MRHIYASLLSIFLVMMTAIPFCMAVDYDFKTMTPEIEQALKNRQARYYQLQGFKQEGVIGEDNKGYVTSLKDDSAAAGLTADENRDRRVIYEALAEQNMLGGAGLLEVQKAFAEVQRDKAGSGDMVQSPDGNWKKKSS
jgi:uncharacterized protein YdbL (DUF1318 family)